MYSITSIFIFIISYYLFNIVSGGSMSFRKINIYSFIFWIQLITLSFLGVNIVANGWIRVFNFNDIVINHGYYSVMYSMIALPLSMLMISKLFNFNAKVEINNYYKSSIKTIISVLDSNSNIIVLILSSN